MTETGFVRSYGDTDFITGIRAIAATMVVIIHTGAFSGYGDIGIALTGAGKYGVDIFFVISGFTVAKTFHDAPNYRYYLTRRIARILPIYWAVILACFVLASFGLVVSPWMAEFGSRPDAYNLIAHLTFLSFLDYRIATSLLGVEWTIPIEVFWYIVLPLMLVRAPTLRFFLLATLGLLVLSAALAWVLKETTGTSVGAKWMPFAYGHYFFIGAYTYTLRKRLQGSDSGALSLYCWGAAAVFLLTLTVNFPGRGEIISLSVAVLLVCLSARRAAALNAVLACRPLLFLGSISYSIYLLHMIAIAGLAWAGLAQTETLSWFIAVYAITVAASAMTYRFIEKPTNDWGRRFAGRFADVRAPAPKARP